MYQTGDTVANTVLLGRDTYNGPVLLVEGANDVKFFRKFVEDSEMIIISAESKENVLDAVEKLESNGTVQGFLGIVDADFGHVDCSLPTSQNVLVTDDHDVEMMIIKTKAFDEVLRELGSKCKIRNFPDREQGIRDTLMQKAVVVGHLRHLSVTDDLHLRFEGLRFEGGFVDRKLNLDIDEMIRRVFELKRIPNIREEDIKNKLSEIIKYDNEDPYQICCGHDFIAIFRIALRNVIGSKSGQTTNPEVLESILRLAYDSEDFQQTNLYSEAKRWSNRNQGYDVFI